MFQVLNGREIFDNGLVRIWRCPNCQSWCDWDQERCRICGLLRDGTDEVPSRTCNLDGGDSSEPMRQKKGA